MPEQSKKKIELDVLPFIVFGILKGYWEKSGPEVKPLLSTRQIYHLVKKPFAELKHPISIQVLRNVVRNLAKIGILWRDRPLSKKPGGGGKVVIKFNLEFLAEHEIVCRPFRSKWYQEFLLDAPEPDKPRFRLMLAKSDMETAYSKIAAQPLTEEDFSNEFRILRIENDPLGLQLGLEQFNGTAFKSMLEIMFSGNSFLEIIFKEKEGIKTLAVVARGLLECYLDYSKKEMVTDEEYEISPDIPHMLRISTIKYVVRALGFLPPIHQT